MSFSGLNAWFTGQMRWSQLHALLGPLALDVAAVVVYGFAIDRIEKGESGIQFRVQALVLVGLSAFINWRGALASRNLAEEVFFPIMSVMVYWMAHSILGARVRDVHRAQHGYVAKARVEPLPPLGALVWVPGIGAPLTALRVLRAHVRKRLALKVPASVRRTAASATASASASASGASAISDRERPPAIASVATESASGSASGPAATASPGASATGPASASGTSDRGGHGSQAARIRHALATLRAERGGPVEAADVVGYLRDQGTPVVIGRVNDEMRRERERLLRVVRDEETA
jgi:hypothetical protein